MRTCHACKRELILEREIGRKQECPICHADLHCCLNCKFFDRSAPKQCQEPVAELVREKDKANFCDHFVYLETGTSGSAVPDTEKARKALDDLFKK
jgi:hypothetical protein